MYGNIEKWALFRKTLESVRYLENIAHRECLRKLLRFFIWREWIFFGSSDGDEYSEGEVEET